MLLFFWALLNPSYDFMMQNGCSLAASSMLEQVTPVL